MRIVRYNPDFPLTNRWMPADEILPAPMGYDPSYGDQRLCLCGHTYERHFDGYEDGAPVGCKYCHGYEEGVEYRRDLRPPDGCTDEEWVEWWKVNDPPASICSGFKLDVSTEPERVIEDLWPDNLLGDPE